MGDFKTAWMTLCNPRSMFIAQVQLPQNTLFGKAKAAGSDLTQGEDVQSLCL